MSTIDPLDRSNETIAAARKGFDKARLVRIIGERSADLVDGKIDTVLEIDECRFAPEIALDFITRDHRATVLGEKLKHTKGLRLQLDKAAIFPQLAGGGVKLKGAEPEPSGTGAIGWHGDPGARKVKWGEFSSNQRDNVTEMLHTCIGCNILHVNALGPNQKLTKNQSGVHCLASSQAIVCAS